MNIIKLCILVASCFLSFSAFAEQTHSPTKISEYISSATTVTKKCSSSRQLLTIQGRHANPVVYNNFKPAESNEKRTFYITWKKGDDVSVNCGEMTTIHTDSPSDVIVSTKNT